MGLVKRVSNEITYLRAALRSLKRIGAVYENRTRTFADIIEGFAASKPDNVAILDGGRQFTYRELDALANRYARWAK